MDLFTTPIGTLRFPALRHPEEFRNDGKPKYFTNLVLEGAEAAELASKVDEWLEESMKDGRTDKCQEPPYKPVLDSDKEPIPGKLSFKFSVPASTKKRDGEIWDRQPKLVDSKGALVDLNPGAGSKARIKFSVYKWKMPAGAGVTLQPVAVQIVEFVAKTEEGAGFEEIEGGFEAATEAASSDGDF